MASAPSFPSVEIWPDKRSASVSAAHAAAAIIRESIARRGRARILVATGNSQIDLIDCLAQEPGIAWEKVDAFHLDEYVGIAANHSASFRLWIRTRFAQRLHPGSMHYIEGDAPEPAVVLREYGAKLDESLVDLAFVGIGENGHIAFNDPPVADFADPATIKIVTLDHACREQQVNEGHFPSLAAVPQQAYTLTCSGLFRVAHWICCVPEARKAAAVQGSLEGPISTTCPGSLVQKHPAAAIFLDTDSAQHLSPAFVRSRCQQNPRRTE